MSLNELNEALAAMGTWNANEGDWPTIVDAARQYAAGTTLQWCQRHESEAGLGAGFVNVDALICQYARYKGYDRAVYRNDDAVSCSIVEKWISDPPARRTVT